MIILVCYLSILPAILVQRVCVFARSTRRQGGGGAGGWGEGGLLGPYMSSILMSSQHVPIKLHNLLSFFPLTCLSVNLACCPSFTLLLSLQVNSAAIPLSDASDQPLPKLLMT